MFENKTHKKVIKMISTSVLAVTTVAPLTVPIVTYANSENLVDRILPVGSDFDSDEMPGVLSYLIIKEDDVNFTTGDHFRLSLPSGVKWKTNHYSPNTVFTGLNGSSFTVVHASERDLELSITGNWDSGKNSVQIPLYFKIDGAKGELQVTIDSRTSTITSGKYTFARVPEGMVVAEILVDKIPTIVADIDNKFETAEITLKEGSTGIWSRGKLEITLPDWIQIIDAKVLDTSGFAINGKEQLQKNLDKAIANETNKIQVEFPSSTQNQKREIKIKFVVSPKLDAEGEITARFNWSGMSSKTVVIGKVISEEPTDKVIFTIGQKTYIQSGIEKNMDVAPFIEANRTFLPIRYVAEALGIEDDNIKWDHNNRIVTIQQDKNRLQFTIGSNIIKLNNQSVEVDIAPRIVNNRTMLPLRAVSEALGTQVVWNEAEQTIFIQ